ncbi:hypothetical protein QUB63_20590 [Microcoleus sp. ARI1-B5]|uniref:hypothetical protein n=1 Tax=unclassified Microcoleus TaxID=2642155 RepID=UPI002FCF4F96
MGKIIEETRVNLLSQLHYPAANVIKVAGGAVHLTLRFWQSKALAGLYKVKAR